MCAWFSIQIDQLIVGQVSMLDTCEEYLLYSVHQITKWYGMKTLNRDATWHYVDKHAYYWNKLRSISVEVDDTNARVSIVWR